VVAAPSNDRAVSADYVALSSTLLFTWALGSAVGPTAGTYALQLVSPSAFFIYVMILTLVFTLFALWRLSRRKADRIVETREDFLTYPQTSPEIYAWLPYHREAPKPQRTQGGADAPADVPRDAPADASADAAARDATRS
jgi:hypothetical protein